MNYTVELTLRTRRPLTRKQIFDVAQIGGAAVGKVGGRVLETTLTGIGDGVRRAVDEATKRVLARCPGRLLAVNAMSSAEFDRRQKRAARSKRAA